ncbi:MAG: hypothetical protein HYX66_00905 [Ignavibacteria bacterium]|nr:hypothetical protein [Ignavibacteria bacterium]
MAFLGYSVRIVVSSDNIHRSVHSWSGLGFDVQGESAGRVRLSDGQILLTLMPDHCLSPTLAYFHHDVSALMKECFKAGLDVADCSNRSSKAISTLRITVPECGEIYVHEHSDLTITSASKEQSPLLGYFDSLVLGVPKIESVKIWAEHAGYFIQEEWREPFPQVDVTDGLAALSFRKMHPQRFLSYSADLDRMYLEEIGSVCEELAVECVVVNADLIKLTMPEGTVIMISNDMISERGLE